MKLIIALGLANALMVTLCISGLAHAPNASAAFGFGLGTFSGLIGLVASGVFVAINAIEKDL